MKNLGAPPVHAVSSTVSDRSPAPASCGTTVRDHRAGPVGGEVVTELSLKIETKNLLDFWTELAIEP